MAQEQLYDLTNAQNIVEFDLDPSLSSRSANVEINKFIYVVETLNIPFFDDFTKDRIKRFDAKVNDANVSLKIDYDFKVNGDAPVFLDYMTDTTWSIVKTTSGEIIETANPTLFITFFQNGDPIGADTGWTNIIESFDEATGLVTFDTLLPDEALINYPDTFYKVADDLSLWVPPTDTFDSNASAPLVNNSFAKNPLTQGYATFDGTDVEGFPYDATSETSYGRGDQLISKPLMLDSFMNNVYLSFFYQAGGHGNLPDPEDSLTLQFFDLQDSTWRSVWSAAGPPVEDTLWSNQVYVPISGRAYLQPGFRFRFLNYATLSGSLDHWHVDYVRLQEDRDTIAEDTINDVAFTEGIRSFLSPYQSVPYAHYNQDPGFFEDESVAVEAVNLGGEAVNMQGLRYEVYTPSGALAFTEITADPNIGAFTRRRTLFPLADEGLFPDVGTASADFEVRCLYTATGLGNEQRINDTVRTYQEFRNYYAYDDGSAEKAYALTGAGLKLSYEFNTPITDTLRAIYFNFPQMLHNENEDLQIELLVWDDLNEDPIYVAEQLIEPTYTKANRFVRFRLEEPVIVSDRFFVGFRQVEPTKIYVGFDVNTNSADRIRYEINGTWYTSSFQGSLMIRPHFGSDDLLDVPELTLKNKVNEFRIYPNPSTGIINLDLGEQSILEVEVFDIYGRHVRTYGGGNMNLDLSNLPNGFYVIQATDVMGKQSSEKLILRR